MPTPAVLVVGMEPLAERAGGANRFVAEYVRALRRVGAPIALVTVPTRPSGTGRARTLPERLLQVSRDARRAARGASVVNTHFALYGLPAQLLGRGRPSVVHFHGPWAAESVAEAQAPSRAIRVKHALEAASYRRATAVVVLSDAFGKLVVEQYGVDPALVHVIPPGVDLEHFAPGDREVARTAVGVPAGVHVTLAVRRLARRMGLEDLVEAWAQAALWSGPDAHLYLVGEGAARADLERLVADRGLGDRVHLVGRVSDELLPAWYRAADVTVVPSLELEGFGLIVLESLASGTPVIATRVGGLAEVLPRLGEHLLVPPHDVPALAARLGQAIRDRSSLPSSAQCRALAQEFHWDTNARRTLDLIERTTDMPTPERVGS